MNASNKRKRDTLEDERAKEHNKADNKSGKDKKSCRNTASTSNGQVNPSAQPAPSKSLAERISKPSPSAKGKEKATDSHTPSVATKKTEPKRRIKKLVPSRPFPTVPTSVSATGPRSAHKEGKNYICLTRKTPLGMYLRRCKDVIMQDGFKTLHLSAMGAAIPHLVLLTVSLPSILPYASDEIHTEILTGTVGVQDEVIPEDEDEDITYETRSKSTMSVVIKIGDGDDESKPLPQNTGGSKEKHKPGRRAGGSKGKQGEDKARRDQQPMQVVFQEPEQEDEDMDIVG